MAGRVTIHDVAREARTSISTVSKVLSNGSETGRISADCAKRVDKARAKLDYVPNRAGRSLRTGRSYAMGGLVGMKDEGRVSPFQVNFYAPVTSGMLSAASRLGLQFVAIPHGAGGNGVDTGLEYLRRGRIDGLVVSGSYYADWSRLAPHMKKGMPVVLAGWPVPENVPVRVDIDTVTPMGKAVDMLLGLGHGDIAWIGPSSETNVYSERRRKGFELIMSERGIASRILYLQNEGKAENLEDKVSDIVPGLVPLMKSKDRPTAVIAFNEAYGIALYEACGICGLRVPRDISVVGFDDIYAAGTLPAMTVVSLELFEVGARALELTAAMADGTRKPDSEGCLVEFVPGRLVVRNSTGPAPEKDLSRGKYIKKTKKGAE